MNREIKFRAWDKEWNKMFYFSEPKVWQHISTAENYSLEFGKRHLNSDNLVDAKLMQFTGLKDKNGKEIYEGDILVYTGTSPPHYFNNGDLFIVEWVLNRWVGTRIKDKTQGDYCGGNHLEDWLMSSDREVIGNIYENPELLKGSD